MSSLTNDTFFKAYFGDLKSLFILILVCCLIAIVTAAFNGMGWPVNIYFSLGFGLPISIIETFVRTRGNLRLSDLAINSIAMGLGCAVGAINIYAYLVFSGIMPFGFFNDVLLYNFTFGFFISLVAFNFFWTRYRTQSLTLDLRNQQLKSAEAEKARMQAEHQLLQSQMQPHFLFNTLANIQTLVDLDPKKSKAMIADLSTMLRASMKNAQLTRCKLSEELTIVQAYLNIQQVRTGDRIHYQQQLDETSLNYEILPMLLQPIIENSIKHGLDKTTADLHLSMAIHCQGQRLVIIISDQHPVGKQQPGQGGLSLSNIRQRLELAYNNKASFISHATDQGWYTELQLPIEKKES